MLEIFIILCLAGALFFLLRHYPEAREAETVIRHNHLKEFFARFSKMRRSKKEVEIARVVIDNANPEITPKEVIDAVNTYSDLEPATAENLYVAEKSLDENDLRQAEEKSLAVIAENKHCSGAYIVIGKVAQQRGQFDDAKEAFLAAVKCHDGKDISEAYFNLGLIESKNENRSNAIKYLEKAINAEKGKPEWYFELGKAYMDVRQYAKAAKVLKRAASLDIDNQEYKTLSSEAEEKQRTHSFYSRGK